MIVSSAFALMDNRLLFPSKKPLTDIGYKHPSDLVNQKFQKSIVKIQAELREIEGSFKLKKRDVTRKDCFVDPYDFDVCPEDMVQCTGTEEKTRGYAIKHEEKLTEQQIWMSVSKEDSYDNAFYGDIYVPPNYGAIDGSRTRLVYGRRWQGENPRQLFDSGWVTKNGKFGMLMFNYGSGWGQFKVSPKPSRYKKITGNSSWGSYRGHYGITSADAHYATYWVEWDHIPSSLSFICDDYCLISKPNGIAGYRGKGCKEGWKKINRTTKKTVTSSITKTGALTGKNPSGYHLDHMNVFLNGGDLITTINGQEFHGFYLPMTAFLLSDGNWYVPDSYKTNAQQILYCGSFSNRHRCTDEELKIPDSKRGCGFKKSLFKIKSTQSLAGWGGFGITNGSPIINPAYISLSLPSNVLAVSTVTAVAKYWYKDPDAQRCSISVEGPKRRNIMHAQIVAYDPKLIVTASWKRNGDSRGTGPGRGMQYRASDIHVPIDNELKSFILQDVAWNRSLTVTDFSAGYCELKYIWYEYVCPNENGIKSFENAGKVPPFDRSDIYNENMIPWKGPIVNTGGDCGGSCGSYGCSCNSPTPPEGNCVRPKYTCPIDPNIKCARVPTGQKKEVNSNYRDGFLFDIGKAEHYQRALHSQKICPGQTDLQMKPYTSVIVENVGDHAFTYATRPYVSRDRHSWQYNSMKTMGISVSRMAFLLNDGKWYVYKNRQPYGACGFSTKHFHYLPDGMLQILEWYPESKCYYYSSPTKHECAKKIRLKPKDGKYVVAISDIETVARTVFGEYGCTGDNSFDWEFKAYPEDLGEKYAKVLKRNTIRIEEPLVVDLSDISARNVASNGAEWDPDRKVCRMKTPGKCLKDNYRYVASIDACVGPIACNGYINPQTGACEEIPNTACLKPGYTFNSEDGICEKEPDCPGGEFVAVEERGEMCVSSDFTCAPGFSYNDAMHACTKSGLEESSKVCPESFLHTVNRGRTCEGSVQTSVWKVFDPAKQSNWVLNGDTAVQKNNARPSALIASNYYEYGYIFSGYMGVANPNRTKPINKTKHYMGIVVTQDNDGFFYIIDYNGQNKNEVGGQIQYRLIKTKLAAIDSEKEWWKNSSQVQVLRTANASSYEYGRASSFKVRYIKPMNGSGHFALKFEVDGRVIFDIQDTQNIIGDGNVPGKPGVISAFQDKTVFARLKIEKAWPQCPIGYINKPLEIERRSLGGHRVDSKCVKVLDNAVIDMAQNQYIAVPKCKDIRAYGTSGPMTVEPVFDKDIGKCIYKPQCLQ